MKNVKELQKTESVTFRMTAVEAAALQQEASNELLSISSLVRRKVFINRLKATA